MAKGLFLAILVFCCLSRTLIFGQEVRLRAADPLNFPARSDGNSPSFWFDGRLRLLTSVAWPVELSESSDLFGEWQTREVDITNLAGKAIWAESVWLDAGDTLYGWYHTEPWGLYEDSLLTAPLIGAFVSFDGGQTIHDLGIILETGDELDPNAANGYFTGGHGDFSVVLDREKKYFYFFFTNYGGPTSGQGVCVARMAFADRFEPAGRVYKYHAGEWEQPGVGGKTTPIFPAVRSWRHADPDCFWGPAVHWNTYLNSFVMVLNHAYGEPGWSQEGIYVSFASDLSRPDAWKKPTKILDVSELPGTTTYYPQVVGLEVGGTDTLVGRTGRFFVGGASKWEIVFYRPTDSAPPKPEIPPEKHYGPKPR